MGTALTPEPLTPEAFAPFGSVVQAAATAVEDALRINAGTAMRHEAVPALDLQRDGGRAVLAVYDAEARRFPFTAHALERHRLSDQVFLPLGAARRAVLLVATPGDSPDRERLRAFVTDGHQGVRIAAGTWHHPLLALDAGAWAVLERRGADVDCEVVALEPAQVVEPPC
jgi:ureidoglycolate lyase